MMEGDVSGENPNDFIQNQNSNDQVANFRISGSGIFGGNLGIQTANPQYLLDVNGKARFSGEVAIQGTAGSNIITGTRGSDGEVKFTVDNQGNVWNSGAYSGASLGAWTVSPKGHNAFMKFGGGSGWVEFHLYNDQGDIDRTFYYRIGNTLDLRTRVNSTGANDMSIMNFNNDGSVFFFRKCRYQN